jgi:hypothetical protein
LGFVLHRGSPENRPSKIECIEEGRKGEREGEGERERDRE